MPIIFKGSGFYVTDNRKASPVTPAEPLKEGGEKKETVAATSETKPEPVAKKE